MFIFLIIVRNIIKGIMSLKPRKVNFDEIWSQVKETIEVVITLQPLRRESWNDRFSDVYELCVSHPDPQAQHLYQELRGLLDHHVKDLLEMVLLGGNDKLLANYYNEWKIYSKGAFYLNNLCSYLNNQHVRKSKLSDAEQMYATHGVDSIEEYEVGELAMEMWRQNMIVPLEGSLRSAILDCVHQHRLSTLNNDVIEIVKGTVDSFVAVYEHKKRFSLELYQKLVEKPVLAASNEYFQLQSARWLLSDSMSEYMQKVLDMFQAEESRCKLFMHRSSYGAMRRCCETAMVVDHLPSLYAECSVIVMTEQNEDMSRMYQILRTIPNGSVTFSNELKTHIVKAGISEMTNLQGENIHLAFVELMLELYTKYKLLIKIVFCNDQSFVGCLDKACSEIANYKPAESKSPSRSPELLAKFCDHYLKKTTKGINNSDVEEKLTEAITVFKYIDDKDVFQKFYARMLGKRLIYQLSHSMDAEESMINRLKQTCGYEFTNKLHRMFTDIKISEDLSDKFSEEYLKVQNIDLGFNFAVCVLQAGAWPLSMVCPLIALPEEIATAIGHFEMYYGHKFNGRKLTWLQNLSQGDLKIGYTAKPYIITVQTYQGAVLKLFEHQDAMTLSDISLSYPLERDFLIKVINTLIDTRLIIPNAQLLDEETTLELNFNFRSKRIKVRVPTVNVKDNVQETIHTVTSVEEDRKLFLQATIVRLMKSRKIMKHSHLVQEVINLCSSFTPSINVIKKCIETLIEKQYIERTSVSEEYSYIA